MRKESAEFWIFDLRFLIWEPERRARECNALPRNVMPKGRASHSRARRRPPAWCLRVLVVKNFASQRLCVENPVNPVKISESRNARPHPNPLPQERERRRPVLGFALQLRHQRAFASLRLCVEDRVDPVNPVEKTERKSTPRPFPSPRSRRRGCDGVRFWVSPYSCRHQRVFAPLRLCAEDRKGLGSTEFSPHRFGGFAAVIDRRYRAQAWTFNRLPVSGVASTGLGVVGAGVWPTPPLCKCR